MSSNDTERTLTGYLTIPVGVNVDLHVVESENGYILEVTKEGQTQYFELKNGIEGTQGNDGVSPTVTTTQTEFGTNVVITDKNGDHSFEILNGQKGESGNNGVSPTVNVSETSSGASVMITDVNGEHLFSISNGSRGAKGNDGFSPTVTTTQTTTGATVVITDVNGAHYYTVNNGIPGPKGDPGDAFRIVKTYPSTEAMNLDYSGTDVKVGEYVMIVCDPDDADNGKVYIKGTVQYSFVVDMAGFIRAIPEPPEEVGLYNLKGVRTDDGDSYIWNEADYDKELIASVPWHDYASGNQETVDLSDLKPGDICQFVGDVYYDISTGNWTYWYSIAHTFIWPESESYTYQITNPSDNKTATVALTSSSIAVSVYPWYNSGVSIRDPEDSSYIYIPKVYRLTPSNAPKGLTVHLDESTGNLDKTWQEIHDVLESCEQVIIISTNVVAIVTCAFTNAQGKCIVADGMGNRYSTESSDGYPKIETVEQ